MRRKIALDFKTIRDPAYKMQRMLSAPSKISKLMNERIKVFKNVDGAIIFPEQLLAIDHAVFSVKFTKGTSGFSIALTRYERMLLQNKITRINTVDDLIEAEEKYEIDNDYPIMLATPNGSSNYNTPLVSFYDLMLFTSKPKAIKFASNIMNSLSGELL